VVAESQEFYEKCAKPEKISSEIFLAKKNSAEFFSGFHSAEQSSALGTSGGFKLLRFNSSFGITNI